MSTLLSATEAIGMIPGWRPEDVVIEELKGGLTNRTFMVVRGEDTFVLRLNAAHTAAFNLDRISEIAVIRSASAVGIAAETVFADPASGILLSRFLPGQVWTPAEFDDPANIEALCKLLRRVHALPLSGIRFNAVAVARRYAANLESRPGLHAYALRCEDIIGSITGTSVVCCCHNDVIAQNVIATPALKLLDWEYACDNDPLFDLASLIGFHNLDSAVAGNLLEAYSGGADPELRDRLAEQVRLYDAIQWLWLANRQRLNRNSDQAARLESLQQRIG
jgi:thiamine kinase-like enzyme